MALQASHVRFALDVKDRLNVVNLAEYISGAVYPDSRYATKVDRVLTHPTDYATDSAFTKSDFNKGWYTHLLYDDVLKEHTDEHLSEYLNDQDQAHLFAKYTVLKILQDVQDAQAYNVKHYMDMLACFKIPNNEEVGDLENFYSLFKQLYADTSSLVPNDHFVFFDVFKVDQKFVSLIKKYLEESYHNKSIQKFLDTVYEKTLVKGLKKIG